MYHPGIYHTGEYQVFISKNVGVDSSPNFVGSYYYTIYLSLTTRTFIYSPWRPAGKCAITRERFDIFASNFRRYFTMVWGFVSAGLCVGTPTRALARALIDLKAIGLTV